MNTLFKLKTIYILLLICLLIILVNCSFPGKIFLSISWRVDSDIPDATFSCDVPNIPTNINDVVKGAYYPTYRGDYTLTYNYSDSPTLRTLDIPLREKISVLGNEDAYYDLIILKSDDPALYEVPVNF